MKKLFFALLGTLSASAGWSSPDEAMYRLQERCGQSAEAWYKRTFRDVENTKDGQALHSFRNHYNAKLNKCFVITFTTFVNYKLKPPSSSVAEALTDLNENNSIGDIFEGSGRVYTCTLNERNCSSRSEWEQWIKPFLTE